MLYPRPGAPGPKPVLLGLELNAGQTLVAKGNSKDRPEYRAPSHPTSSPGDLYGYWCGGWRFSGSPVSGLEADLTAGTRGPSCSKDLAWG